MAIKKKGIIRDNRNIPYDLEASGNLTPQGAIEELYGKDALNNAITLWAVSQKGESLRRPNRGGYLTQYLLKDMNDDTTQSLQQAIKDGIAIDFNNDLTITFIKVEPNYEKSRWEIQLQVFSSRLKLFTDTLIVIRV